MATENTLENNNSSIKTAIRIVAFFLKIIFPAYVLLKINSGLHKASRFNKDPYLGRQIKKNIVAALVLSSTFFLPLALGSFAIYKNSDFNNKITLAKKSFEERQVKKTINYLDAAFSERKFIFVLKFVGGLSLIGMIVSNFAIYFSHDIVKNSKKLIKILKAEGILDKDNKNPLAIWTPVGILMDIYGSAPKEISVNERIWLAMNIQVKDWVEDPEKRSLVFFKTAFKLQNRYDYFLPKDFK